jgi:hypothetical protein
VSAERLLPSHRRRNRLRGRSEGDEESVPLGRDLDAVISRPYLSQKAMVSEENLAVTLTEALQQRSRSLDIPASARSGPPAEGDAHLTLLFPASGGANGPWRVTL